jgi:hypothetical protein
LPTPWEETVLPSSKRAPRNEEAINTGDFEVVHTAPKSKASSQRPAARARAPQPSVSDEEATQLFSGSTRAMLPPRPDRPVQTPSMRAPRAPDMNLRGIVREGREKPAVAEKTNLRGAVRPRSDAEDHTILRPMGVIPPAARIMNAPVATATPKPPSVKPAMMPSPYQPTQPQQVLRPSAPPVTVSMNAPGGTDARGPAPSDPNADPPSSVVTARTRSLRPRSTASWAAALVAVGAVVGLITAIVARGDADSLIDATATMVDPHHGNPERANGAAAQAAVLPAFIETAKPAPPSAASAAPGACLDVGESTVSAPPVVNTPPPASSPPAKTASLPEPSSAARPTPPRPAPMAYAAPSRPAPRSAPAPTSDRAQAPSGSGGWLAAVTPRGAGAPIARPSKAAPAAAKTGGDFESAAAADALAKAQLEASLR